MPIRRSVFVRSLVVGLALAVGGPLLAGTAASATTAAAGSTGHDVSYPQCNAALPTSGSFGIVGVTNGVAYSANPCLGAQWQWASGRTASPALYTTPANPAPTSSHYWPVSGSRDPALCLDSSSTTDAGCAYDYGWHAAANALSTATASVASASQAPWWLDVETGNTYNGDGVSNAADLQGMIDYLRGQGVPSVGYYSTSSQWIAITGGWTTTNDASYRASWSQEFTPAFPMADGPDWVAGASSITGAQANCGTSFTGGVTTVAQYPDGNVDGDLACASSTPTAVPSPTGSPSATASPTASPSSTASTGPSSTATPSPTATATATATASPSSTASPSPTATATATTSPSSSPPAPAPATVPGTPTDLLAATATGGAGTALTWLAPASDGGSAISSYTVYRSTSTGSESAYATVSCGTACTAFADKHTKSGRRYYYQVAATNATGTGMRSTESSATAR